MARRVGSPADSSFFILARGSHGRLWIGKVRQTLAVGLL
jgi:hypothetical protein